MVRIVSSLLQEARMAWGRDELAWSNWTCGRVDDPEPKHANNKKSEKESDSPVCNGLEDETGLLIEAWSYGGLDS